MGAKWWGPEILGCWAFKRLALSELLMPSKTGRYTSEEACELGLRKAISKMMVGRDSRKTRPSPHVKWEMVLFNKRWNVKMLRTRHLLSGEMSSSGVREDEAWLWATDFSALQPGQHNQLPRDCAHTLGGRTHEIQSSPLRIRLSEVKQAPPAQAEN